VFKYFSFYWSPRRKLLAGVLLLVLVTTAGIVTFNTSSKNAAVNSAKPDPVQNVVFTQQANSTRVLVTWEKPKYTGNGSITSYVVTATSKNPDVYCTLPEPNRAFNPDTTECTLDGLDAGITYTISVVAKNSYGVSTSAPVPAKAITIY